MKIKTVITSLLFAATSLGFADDAQVIRLEESTIPTLDMNEYYNFLTKSDFLNKLARALQKLEFFAITNTGVASKTLDQSYDATKTYGLMNST